MKRKQGLYSKLDMSSKELAEKLNYKNANSVIRIESGETSLTTTKLYEVAKALHTTMSYLIGESNNPTLKEENPFELETVSIRLVKDAPLFSEHIIDSPETAISVVGDMLSEFDRAMVMPYRSPKKGCIYTKKKKRSLRFQRKKAKVARCSK